jgi:light-regulated signal transduction histidine kinase (bacteriophytochrome)
VPTDPIIVSADRERVLQVLSNLIGNSLKHAKGAPIDLAVERQGRLKGGYPRRGRSRENDNGSHSHNG